MAHGVSEGLLGRVWEILISNNDNMCEVQVNGMFIRFEN
jgi:hypothetical protein